MKKYIVAAALALVLGTAAYTSPAQAIVSPVPEIIIPVLPTAEQIALRNKWRIQYAVGQTAMNDTRAVGMAFANSAAATMWAVNYKTQTLARLGCLKGFLNAPANTPSYAGYSTCGFSSAAAMQAAREALIALLYN